MRRVIGSAAVLLLTAAGTWLVATQTESPAQVAARAEPPAPEPVVAELALGYVHGAVSLAVDAQREAVVTLKAPAAVTGVVTASDRAAGHTLEAGTVLVRVNSRPVFVLGGAFPLYRDIRPGDTGDDVVALQHALQAAGYQVGAADGDYGSRTQAAVRAMYRDAGYDVPEVKAPAPEPTAPAEQGSPAPEAESAPGEGAGTEDAPGPQPADVAPRPGPVVLRSEVLMVARLPATVAAVAAVGTPVADGTDLATFAAGGLVLAATLPEQSLGSLALGATGTFTDGAGAQATAQVVGIDPPGADGQVRVTTTTSGTVAAGGSYVLTVEDPALEQGESLLAPVAAVVSRGGASYVYVHEGAQFREVQVEVVDSVGGVAAIRPSVTTEPLAEGTEVRIG